MKYSILCLLVLSLMISCNNQEKKIVQKSNMNDTAVNIATKLFEKFNAHDWAGMAAFYTDTADFKDPSLGTSIIKQTRQQTITKYTQLSEAIKDVRDSVIATYPSGNNTIVVEFISKGTAPDGSKFELPICSILTINDKGLIEKDYTYYDNSENK